MPDRSPSRAARSKTEAAEKKHAGSRDRAGHFMPGVSGNPNGRPKGSRNKTTLLVEALLEDEAESLTRALIGKALAGSTHAMELVFARIAPVRRDRHLEITLPGIETIGDLALAHARVITAVAAGEVSPAEGRDLSALLDQSRRFIETTELASRIASLEERLSEGRTAYAN